MTGLVLIVPPKTAPGTTTVWLPPAPNHVAWLGFGFDGAEPSVCDTNRGDPNDMTTKTRYARLAAEKGICYVDLNRWTLDPYGTDGEVETASIPYPRSILSTTQVTGNKHKISPGANVRKISFVAGWLSSTFCSLAEWSYVPKTANGGNGPRATWPLASVVSWEIAKLTDTGLRFTPGSGPAVDVKLLNPASGRIELLLVNVPVDDLKDLPPQPATLQNPPPPRAAHFAEYYKHLADASGNHNAPSVIPEGPRRTASHACVVNITLPPDKQRLVPDEANAVGTYACMPATGEGP